MMAPSQSFSISIFFPAFNDERTIGELVNAALEILPALTDDYEVIVVDNASGDETAAGARAAGARIVAEPRRGYGRACRAGVAAVATARSGMPARRQTSEVVTR